ncbi:MAG TPA: AI-2E family transporter, partial [Acidimicrobiales bacterium]|nr:AI-2E family transporter [Acidimicrobiales bacterium]
MARAPGSSVTPERGPVPVRTIVTVIALAIAMSLATVLGIVVAMKLGQIIGLLVVAAFFTIVLCPAVDFLVRQRMRRSFATILVYFVGFGLLAAMLFTFVRPIVSEVNKFIDDFPTFVENAQEGRGSIGRLVQRYDIDEYIERNQNRLESALRNAGTPALEVARSVVSGLFTFLTVMVLT